MADGLSKAEGIKAASAGLAGSLATELADGTDAFSGDSEVLLKFHGVYAQDNRDVRSARKRAKQDVERICMVRAGIPGGAVTADQYLALDDLATTIGGSTLRVTTRQGIQFHFVSKADLRDLVHQLNESMVTTLGACGDVVRNVVCCPAPLADREAADLQGWARELHTRTRPRTNAYWSLWVDGEMAASASPAPVEEPLYGGTYLPRKFKVAIAWPGDNCVDVYSQDVGLVPVLGPDGGLEAFTVLVGGGLGKSHTDPTTFPRLGTPLADVAPGEVAEVVEAVVRLHRDEGNRAEREHARLKYVVEDWGIERIRADVERRLGRSLAAPSDVSWETEADHLGWHEGVDGTWFLGVPVRSGRIKDDGAMRLRSGLRAVVEQVGAAVRFTARQDVLLNSISAADRDRVDAILREHGVAAAEDLHGLDRSAMACPALPTCGLALGEAERVLPEVLTDLHAAFDAAGVGEVAPHMRMTGCPNGCARPYTAEVGIVGRGKTSYDVHLGGDPAGTRMNEVFAVNIPREKVGPVLTPLLEHFSATRRDGESLGDFCHREGVASLRERFGDESFVRPARGARAAPVPAVDSGPDQ